MIYSGSPVEFVFLADILNTGKPLQLIPQYGDPKAPLTWFELEGTGNQARWVGHQVSDRSYGHGIGAGDVNSDQRTDIVTPKGWFEAPANPRHGEWAFHPDFDLGVTGFIHATDINGDGDLDIAVGGKSGLFIFENLTKSR